MFPLENGETVVRVRGKLVADSYSGEMTKRVWDDNPDELDIVGVAIAPSTGSEFTTEDRKQTVVGMSLYAEPGVDVLPDDRIRARSGLWQVEGVVADYLNALTGWNPGVEFRIRKVAG